MESNPTQLKPLQRKALPRVASFASLIRVDPNWDIACDKKQKSQKNKVNKRSGCAANKKRTIRFAGRKDNLISLLVACDKKYN